MADTDQNTAHERQKCHEIRIRVPASLRAAIQREAKSEAMSMAAFTRACVVRILRARHQ